MADLLSIAGNSVKTNQSALAIVGNNIANANMRAMSGKVRCSGGICRLERNGCFGYWARCRYKALMTAT